MPNIDIPVSVELERLFELPVCADIEFPKPASISVQLPSGGSMKAIADVSKGIPSDCALTFSMLVQLAPLLASLDCLVKVLKLLKPLIDVVQGLPVPPVKAIQDFGKAASELAPCLLIPTPAAMIPFVRDILCLILKILHCFIGQMNTVIGFMEGLTVQIEAAESEGNAELIATLQCAQDNAATSAAHLMKSIEPVGVILELVGPFMDIAGVGAIQLPGPAGGGDVTALKQSLQSIESVVDTMQSVVDSLGGCPS